LDSNLSRYSRSGIDLHVHSTASDGTLTPAEIIELAHQTHLAAIAITDHDTLKGVREALATPIPTGLRFLTGIEISTSPPLSFSISGSIHMLGYGIRVDDSALNDALGKMLDSRNNRNPRIIAKLNALGVAITDDDVRKEAGDSQLGRPHIASCLVKNGDAVDIQDAFDRYLGTGKPAYVNRYRIPAAQVISLIRAAGGIPVLAHPELYGLPDFGAIRELVNVLAKDGMMGLEVYYPEHTVEVTNHMADLARESGLLMTGGTDFHGDLKPDTRLGTGTGDFFVPYILYEKLQVQIDQTTAGQPHIQPMTDNKEKTSAPTDSAMPPLAELELILGYHFQNPSLLEKALTHPTYAHEHPSPEIKDNQRLEFLGDAVLNLVVGHLLMIHGPSAREGELTLMRASLVSESGLAEMARGMNLGAYIKLGVGELATHGREKKSILADTLEAIMAALYLDGGYEKATTIIETLFAPFLGNHKPDPKTNLQERVQKKHGVIPAYRVMDETGPAHDKIFTIELKVGKLITVGTGKSKKSAEKSGAEKALKRLSEIDG